MKPMQPPVTRPGFVLQEIMFRLITEIAVSMRTVSLGVLPLELLSLTKVEVVMLDKEQVVVR